MSNSGRTVGMRTGGKSDHGEISALEMTLSNNFQDNGQFPSNINDSPL